MAWGAGADEAVAPAAAATATAAAGGGEAAAARGGVVRRQRQRELRQREAAGAAPGEDASASADTDAGGRERAALGRPAQSTRSIAAAGSAASFAVTCFCHPIDTLKTLIQHDKRASRNVVEQLLRVLRERGAGGLYAGMPSSLVSSMPISAIYTSSYETFKALVMPYVGDRQAMAHVTGGAMASVCTSFVYTPCETLKNRLQVGQYKNTAECLVHMLRTEGVFKLYAGWGAVLCRNVPQSIIKFWTYEQLKKRLASANGDGKISEARMQLATGAAGGASACTAALFSHAFDTVKTKIMTGTLGIDTRNPLVAIRHIVRTEGFWALYRGLAPRLFIYATQGAIFFGSYETLKVLFASGEDALRQLGSPRPGQQHDANDEVGGRSQEQGQPAQSRWRWGDRQRQPAVTIATGAAAV